jgi:Glycosyltransferase sugar-binding region containing DXD motif
MISISEKENRELYYGHNLCLSFLRSIRPAEIKNHVKFHMFWKTVRPFGRKQILPVKSYLATQDLKNTSLTLWSDTDLTQNEWLRPFFPYIEFKLYDPFKEAMGTPLEGSRLLRIEDSKVYSNGDLFRSLVTYSYGGVYIDMDVVLLRDFSPILDQEFLYKWGNTTHGEINGAVMQLFPKSRMACELLNCIMTIPAGDTNWGCGSYVVAKKKIPEFTVFPTTFFDLYFVLDEETFCVTPTSSELYDGIFMWHWHNRWDANIEDGSKFSVMEKITDNRLKERGLL